MPQKNADFIKKNDFDNRIKVLENKIRDIEKNTILKELKVLFCLNYVII